MPERRQNRLGWRFFDGSVAISASTLLAILLRGCVGCGGLPVLGYLHMLTGWDDGVIIVATLLLFPAAATLYGGAAVFFAAREAVQNHYRERGRQEGLQEGRQKGLQEGQKAGQKAERERIRKEAAERGIAITPELARILAGESEASAP